MKALCSTTTDEIKYQTLMSGMFASLAPTPYCGVRENMIENQNLDETSGAKKTKMLLEKCDPERFLNCETHYWTL